MAARDEAPQRRAIVEQVLDPRWGERVRSHEPAIKVAAIAERQSQAVSVFYTPADAGLARSAPGVAEVPIVLDALARRIDTAGLASLSLPNGTSSDPLGYSYDTLTFEESRSLHLGHAYLVTGQAGCAVPIFEAVDADALGFPFPQLSAVARARAEKEPCKAP